MRRTVASLALFATPLWAQELTPAERDDPKIINASRRLRIANGSGVKVSDVNQLVDRFFEARKMMAAMAGRMGMPGARKQVRSKKGKKGKKGGRVTPKGGNPALRGKGPVLPGLPDPTAGEFKLPGL